MKFKTSLKWALFGHLLATAAPAATVVWNGAGGTNNWSTTQNWSAAPVNGDTLVFTGAARQTNFNDFLTAIGSLDLSNGGFNITGNAVTMSGDLTNAGSNTWGINTTLVGARTFTISSGVLTFTGSINNGGSNLTIAGPGNATVSGGISGAGGLIKTGAGVLTLSAPSSYTGVTRVSGGTVVITADNQLGAVPGIATPSSIVIDGGILSTTGTFTINANRGIAVGPTSGQGDGTVDVVSGELTYNGVITSNTGSGTGNLVKTGSGTLTLGGTNTYSGNTVVSAGTLKLGSSTAIPSGLSKGDLVLHATLDLNNNSTMVNGFSGSGTGVVTNSLTGIVSFTVGGNNKGGTFNGVIQNGAGTVGLVKTGTGTIVLGGSNTFTGGVTINGGILQLANPGALNSTTPNAVTFGPNAPVGTRLQLGGNNTTISGLATNAAPGSVIVENASANAAVLTINQFSNTTFAGVFQNGTGGGALSLVKSGSGTLTLSGTNIHTGNTTISNGTLQAGIATAIPFGSGTGNVILDGGATAGILDINGFDVSINGLSGTTGVVLGRVVNNRVGTTKTITIGNGDASTTFAGLITNNTGTGGVLNLTKTGTGTLTLTNANSYTGITTIRNGSIVSGVANTLPATTSLTLGDGTTNTSGVLRLNGFNQTLGGLFSVGSGTGNRIVNGSATAVSLSLNLSADSSFGGILGGAGTNENNFSIVKSGIGTLTLSGINTYTGTTAISQGIVITGNLTNAFGSGSSSIILGDTSNTGTLSYTGSSASFTRGFTISAGGGQIDTSAAGQTLTIATGNVVTSGAFTIGGAGNTTITSNITGSGSLNKTGAGNLILSGNNTYSGATNIRNGTITLGVNNTGLNPSSTLTLGDATANTNGILKLDGYSQTLASILKTGNGTGNRIIGGNATLSTLTLNTSAGVNYGGILGGTTTIDNNLALVKTGAGTLTLSGTNTYTGGTTISGGILSISSAVNLGAATGGLAIGNGTLQVTANITSNRAFGLTEANALIAVDNGFTYTHGGVISGTGALNLTGLGTFVTSGTSNTFSGGTNIRNGTLMLGVSNSLPGSTIVTLGSGSNNGRLSLNGYNLTIAGLTTSGGGTANRIVNGKVTSSILTINNESNHTFSGILGGTGTNENAFGITKTGAGTLTLSGTNTYNGDTTINGGILQIGIATTLPSGTGKGNVVLGSGGTLDLAANSISINGLLGSGLVTSSVAGAKILTVGNNDHTGIFSGIIQNGAGTVSLTKVGTGVLTLSGVNTYTGTTTITGGTLRVGNVAAIPSGAGRGNVVVNGTLDLNANNITINGLTGSGTINSGAAGSVAISVGANDQSSTFGGIIANGSGTVGLTKVGSGTLTLGGISTYTGITWIKNGTLALASGNDRLATTSVITLGDGTDSGIFKLDARSQTIGGITVSGTGTNNRVINGSATSATLTINNTTAYDFAGILGGTGTNENNFSLTKTGAGTLTLSGNNTFTGGLTIGAGGIVRVGHAGALNSTAPNNVTFSSSPTNARLQLNGFSVTIGNLATASSNAGSPIVENGGTGPATLTVNQAGNTTFAGILQNGGTDALSLLKSGAGTLTLSGTNTYSGGTTISAGILSIGLDTNIGVVPSSYTSGNIILNGGILNINTSMTLNASRGIALGTFNGTGNGIIDVTASRTLTYNGTFTNNGVLGFAGLTKTGTGIFNLGSTNSTYTAGTIISGGLLNVTVTTGTPLGADALDNNIVVSAGANLSLSAVSNKGALQTITVNSSAGSLGGIGFSNNTLTQAQLFSMFTDSTGSNGGVISINNAINYNTALNLSTFGTAGGSQGLWFLGSASSGTYSASTLTVGSGNRYRLGGGNGTLTLSAAGVLAGSAAVQIGFAGTNGTGTVIVNTTQDYTGGTSILGGTYSINQDRALGAAVGSPTAGNVIINGGALSASSTFTLSANRGIALGPASGSGSGTLDVAGSNILTYGGILANNGVGTGGLTKTGTGTLVLTSGLNSYTGATALNGGILSFTALGDLGAGTAISFNGGTLQYAAGNITDITTRTVTTLANGGATIDTNGNNVTFAASAISGGGSFAKAGAGILTLGIANSYTGATSISNGTLRLGINGALPSTSALTLNGGASAGILDINGLDTTVTNLSGTTGAVLGRIVNNAVGSNGILTVNSTSNSSFVGVLADNTGTGGTLALVKTGGSTLTLGGTNTHTGGTTISTGTLSVSSDANFGGVPGSVSPTNIVLSGGATLATSASMTINANRGISVGPSGTGNATFALTAGTTLAYNGVIGNSGTATGGITKSNTTGVLVLGGANTYAGDTTISGGVLRVNNPLAIPSGSGKGNVSIASTNGGALDLNGNAITINGLSGAGTVTSGIAGTASVTVGSNDQTSSFTGIIQNGSGAVSLGKTGTGTLTLSGNSTFTGSTTISGGVLSIRADNNLGAAPGAPTQGHLVLDGGTLATSANFALSSNRGIVVGPETGSGSGSIAVGAGLVLTYGGIIADNGAGTGGLIKTNTTGTLLLSGASTYSGDTQILGGTLQIGNAAALPSGTGKGNVILAAGSMLDLNNFSQTVNGLSGTGTVTNSQIGAVNLTVGGNNATGSFGGIIQDGNGVVSLTKTGSGTIALGGLNTYSGNTVVNGGTLQLGAASAIPSGLGKGNVVMNGVLDLAGFSTTVNGLSGNGDITNTVGTATTLTVGATDQSSTFAGDIFNGVGSVALTKTGTGTLTLSGNNSYSGATNISAGTISVGSTTALSGNSTVTIAGAGFLDVNGYNVVIDGLLGTGTINNNGASPSILNAGAGGTSTQFDGVIADGTNTIALTKSGAGTLTLTGVNTYSGTTTISNGTVSVANPGLGGNLGTATSAIELGDASNKGTLSYTGNADLNFTRGFTVNNGGGQMNITTAGRTLTLQSGGIVTTGTFTVGGAGNALVSSIISGTGGFTKANTGIMVLSSVNTYSGDTTISSGTLQVTNTGAIPSGIGKGNVNVNGTLDVNNLNLTLNGLSGSGIITNTQGSPVLLTAGTNNASGTFNGVIQDGAGTMSFNKTGSGTLTLGGANTYSGNTSVSGGVLRIANSSAIASGPYKGNVSVAAGGTIDLNDYDLTINGLSGLGLVTNNAGASILTLGANDQTSTFAGNIQDGSGTIGFTKTGTGSLTLSGNNTFTGATNIAGGTVTLGSDTALSPGSTLTIGNAGTLDLNGRVIAIDGLAGTGSLTNNGAADVTLTTGASGGSGTFGGTINDGTGRIALNKTGEGTVALTNANNYSGGTTVTGGTLAITADNVLGQLPSSFDSDNIVLNGGALSALNTFLLDAKRGINVGSPGVGSVGYGTIDVASNQTLTYGGIIANNGSGTGGLVKSGLGTLTLTSANSYTGNTLVSSGTLQIGHAQAMGSGAGFGNLGVNGTLDLNNFSIVTNGLSGSGTISNTKTGFSSITAGANDQTSSFSGTIQNGNGTVGLAKTGSGTLTLSGNSTYTGGTVNSGGVVSLESPGALGSTGTISMNGGALRFSVSNTVDYSPRIRIEDGKTATFDTNGQNVTFSSELGTGAAGTGAVVKEGLGTLTITGNSTYTGSTTVSAGALYVNGSLGNTAVSVASGATLGGSGNIGGHTTVTGLLTPGQQNQIGSIGLNGLDLAGNMLIEWNGNTNFIDRVDVTDLLQIQAGSSLTFSSLGGTLTQEAYVFATYGTLSNVNNLFGTINNLPENYHIVYDYGPEMNQIALVIPEPRAAALGLVGMVLLLRRRRNAPSFR